MSDKFEELDGNTPGTAAPAKLKKAACGIRFEDGELNEGIDFSRAAHLLSDASVPDENDGEPSPSVPDEHR